MFSDQKFTCIVFKILVHEFRLGYYHSLSGVYSYIEQKGYVFCEKLFALSVKLVSAIFIKLFFH